VTIHGGTDEMRAACFERIQARVVEYRSRGVAHCGYHSQDAIGGAASRAHGYSWTGEQHSGLRGPLSGGPMPGGAAPHPLTIGNPFLASMVRLARPACHAVHMGGTVPRVPRIYCAPRRAPADAPLGSPANDTAGVVAAHAATTQFSTREASNF